MAGGTSGKAVSLYTDALAKLAAAERAVQQLSQHGGIVGDPRHAVANTAIVAAIAALQAIQ